MTDITLVMTPQGALRGLNRDDDRSWKRVKAWLKRLRPGDGVTFSYKQRRNLAFHRKYMKMLQVAFEHWEPEKSQVPRTYDDRPIAKDFDRFRKDILVLAGFYEPKYHLDGSVTLEAPSISFDEMDQDAFERIYEPTLKVLLDHILTNYTREDLERVVAELERFGHE